jgi:cardiolipin synthase
MAPNQFLDERLSALRASGYRPNGLIRFGADLWQRSRANAATRPDLRRELRLIRWLGLVPAVLCGVALMEEGVAPAPALLPPVLAWLILCAWVGVELGLVRHPITGTPVSAIGPANVLTLYRGWAAVPILTVGLSLDHATLLAIVLAVSAGLTDLVDGTIAVRLRQESRLGRLLDPVLDSLLFSAVAFDLARFGLLPWWLAALVALRYFSVVLGGIVLLLVLGRSLPIRHTPWGQRSTLAIGLVLALTMSSRFVAIPQAVLLAAYGVTVVTMVLALGGIARRVPTSPTPGGAR